MKAETEKKVAESTPMANFAVPPLETIRVGFIGTGNRGLHAVKRVSELPGVEVATVGDLQDVLAMMPGMNAGALKGVSVDEKALIRTEAMILSMTPYERENPSCLNHSRKRRIAAGSGVRVEDLNKLLKQFEMMQGLMKQMSGAGGKKRKRMMRNLPGGLGGFNLPGM